MMSMNGASLLSFMMRDVDYDPRFLTGAADTLDEFEHQMKDSDFGDAAVWYSHNGYSYFNEDSIGSYADPMAEMMRAMSRQPQVGYDFITEGDRANFYFDKRDWSNDGYDGIAALADRVSTDPDVYAAHPEGAAMVASQFVDWTANSEGFNPEDAKAAGDSIGHLLKTYMPSMAAAMDGGPDDLDPALLAVNPKLPGFGELENMPAFYLEDLEKMTGVAMADQDGMTSIAEGMADYRQTQMLAIADQLKDDPDNAKLINQLNAVALDDSELRGFTTQDRGPDPDRRRAQHRPAAAVLRQPAQRGRQGRADPGAGRQLRGRSGHRPRHGRDQRLVGQHRERRPGRRGGPGRQRGGADELRGLHQPRSTQE